jgi:hypothetical protein
LAALPAAGRPSLEIVEPSRDVLGLEAARAPEHVLSQSLRLNDVAWPLVTRMERSPSLSTKRRRSTASTSPTTRPSEKRPAFD